ncbi:MAG: type II CRISPR-associated endonuclease Cas1 [Kiritimatiellae bacterium]|nr:type II CRISPR-associated endonuclease Cas1 [Kiritimatiellia bacterium]
MIARTLCFSSVGKLSLKYEQLVWNAESGEHRTVPIEDVGFVILESDKIAITSAALQFLSANNVAVVICDKSHTPSAQLLSYAANSTAAESIEAQLSATDAVNGRLWRMIIRQKIRNQSTLMERLGANGAKRLLSLADEVKNGDPANCEAQAARIYFQALGPDEFVRYRNGRWPNAPLNYGYAILRAATARALVGSGLICLRGIHHHNRYNAFALADDIMEPYRPFVDQYVLGKVRPFDVPMAELTKEMRARLLQMLSCDTILGEVRRPLMIALSCTTASLTRYYKKESDELALPSFP